jgi:PKD repeat protein
MKKTSLSLLTMVLFALSMIVNAQTNSPCRLNAKFNVKPDNCSAAFTDASSAEKGTTITSWSWDFGDNTKDTVKSPKHTYTKSGHYMACLSITGVNAKGEKCNDKTCLPVEIKGCNDSLLCRLSAKFESKTDSCTTKFVNGSTAGAGTTITSYHWTFGDGDSATVKDPTHVYAHSGLYMACLTIEGVNATGAKCKDKECHSVIVKGCGPFIDSVHCRLAAIFRSKTDSCTVKFSDASSAGLGTTITSWKWTFGDGDSSAVQNPSHEYKFSGHYLVCLTIEGVNAGGIKCKDRECHYIEMKGCGDDTTHCRLSSKFNSKTDSCTVKFNDASTAGPGTTITSYHWTFGDGDSSTVKNPSHDYKFSGHYLVCLTIEGVNALGGKCKDRECHEIEMKGCGDDTTHCRLSSKFSSKVDSCTVTFNNTSTAGPGTTITSYHWTFGDGDSSTVKNPSHVYAHSGFYSACLTIEGVNALGGKCKDKECHSVMVRGCGPFIDSVHCRLTAIFRSKTDSCTVKFSDASSAGLGTTITSWKWTFGDGDSSAVQNPSHDYKFSGHYTVCLTIEGVNAGGIKCKDRECHMINIKGCGDDTTRCRLSSRFEYKNDSTNFTFTDKSVAGAGTTITGWKWTFGDGDSSLVENPTHLYAKKDKYTVCLTITGKNAAGGTTCKEKECKEVDTRHPHRDIGEAEKDASSMMQFYPNPAKDVVNISYNIPTGGQVNITVTDVQGRILAVIQDGYQAAGDHSVVWSVGVRQGWYLISIKTDAGVEQKQLIIQK